MRANPNNFQETLDILQEECAEVIVEVSKCRRFGFDNTHYKTNITHRKHLEAEIGDVIAMFEILSEQQIIDPAAVSAAVIKKKEKLKQWSKIYEQN